MEKLIVKEDMICPITKKHCDDECCPVGAECNMGGDDIKDPSPDLSDWVLLVDIDFFGRIIFAGTVFRQVNADYYHPIINGARCPSYQIDFMIVKNNPKVFLRLVR